MVMKNAVMHEICTPLPPPPPQPYAAPPQPQPPPLNPSQPIRRRAYPDNLWRARCLEDWGESRCVGPSQMPQSTFLDAWRAWRRAFHRYEGGMTEYKRTIFLVGCVLYKQIEYFVDQMLQRFCVRQFAAVGVYLPSLEGLAKGVQRIWRGGGVWLLSSLTISRPVF